MASTTTIRQFQLRRENNNSNKNSLAGRWDNISLVAQECMHSNLLRTRSMGKETFI